jgi:hypothetical protein
MRNNLEEIMPSTISLALKKQHQIDAEANNLVSMADNALSNVRLEALKEKGFKRSQFSNLSGVARETQSPMVVINWLAYQRKRKSEWQAKEFSSQVLEDLETLEDRAKAIAKQVFESDHPADAEVQTIHITLIRRYIGYLERWFIAKGGQDG